MPNERRQPGFLQEVIPAYEKCRRAELRTRDPRSATTPTGAITYSNPLFDREFADNGSTEYRLPGGREHISGQKALSVEICLAPPRYEHALEQVNLREGVRCDQCFRFCPILRIDNVEAAAQVAAVAMELGTAREKLARI